MAVMFPLVVPLAYEVSDGDKDTMYHAMGTILAGSVFGDHCSPISDTTILSSTACGCDHEGHVYTQLPYAITVGIVSMIFGDLCTGYGSPSYVGIIVGFILLVGIIWVFGTPIPKYTPSEDGKGG